jgi:hypothetical protein
MGSLDQCGNGTLQSFGDAVFVKEARLFVTSPGSAPHRPA